MGKVLTRLSARLVRVLVASHGGAFCMDHREYFSLSENLCIVEVPSTYFVVALEIL